MAKTTLRVPVDRRTPPSEGFLTVRRTLDDSVKAIFTTQDTYIGLKDSTADLTVNGALTVTGGAQGVLKLHNGTNTLRAGDNVVVNYNDDGSVTISTQEGQDISYILSTVQGLDARMVTAEGEIDALQAGQAANAANIASLNATISGITNSFAGITNQNNTILGSFLSLENRVMSAEETVSSVLASEAAQNSRLTTLENDLLNEIVARTSGDSALSTQIGTLSSNLSAESASRIAGDNALSSTITSLSSSLALRITTSNTNIASLSQSLASLSSSLNSSISGLSSSFSSRITNLSSSLNSSIGYFSGAFASRITPLELRVSSISSSLNSLQGDYILLENRVDVLEFTSSSFSTSLNSVNLSMASLSSSVAADINQLRSLLLGGTGGSGIFDVGGSSSDSLFNRVSTIENTLNTLTASVSSQYQTLNSLLSSSNTSILNMQETLVDYGDRIAVLEYASGSFASSINELFDSLFSLSGSLSTGIQAFNSSVTSLSSSVAADINLIKNSGGGTSSSVAGTFAFNEVPAGVIDGVNGTFELSNEPSPPSSLMLFYNGQLLNVGSQGDYLLSGKVITFISGIVPAPDDTILATYRYNVATKSYAFNEPVVLTSTGGVLQGVLDYEPDPPNSLMLFYNGQLLTAGVTGDYTLNGKNVEVTGVSSGEDDVALATYSHS